MNTPPALDQLYRPSRDKSPCCTALTCHCTSPPFTLRVLTRPCAPAVSRMPLEPAGGACRTDGREVSESSAVERSAWGWGRDEIRYGLCGTHQLEQIEERRLSYCVETMNSLHKSLDVVVLTSIRTPLENTYATCPSSLHLRLPMAGLGMPPVKRREQSDVGGSIAIALVFLSNCGRA